MNNLHNKIIDRIRNPIIHTERCILTSDMYERFSFRKIFPLYKNINHEGYFSPNGPIGLRGFRAIYRNWQLQHNQWGRFHFLITSKDDSFLVGIASIGGNPNNQNISIGIGIHSDFRRKGYAEEIYHSLLSWANEEGIDTVFHSVNPNNTASKRLAERMGGNIIDIIHLRGELVYEIPTNPCSPSNPHSEM